MISKYEQIKQTEGEEAAKAYMREIRSHVKKPSGVASLPIARRLEIAKKAAATRKRNNETKQALKGQRTPHNKDGAEAIENA